MTGKHICSYAVLCCWKAENCVEHILGSRNSVNQFFSISPVYNIRNILLGLVNKINSCPVDIDPMSPVRPQTSQRFVPFMPHLSQRFVPSMTSHITEVCPLYASLITEVCPQYDLTHHRGLSPLCLTYHRGLSPLCLTYDRGLSPLCLTYHRGLDITFLGWMCFSLYT